MLGEYDFRHEEADSQVYYTTALQVLLHPGFDPSTYENDIALIRIPDAPCEADNICTLCLPDGTIAFPGSATTEAPANGNDDESENDLGTTTMRPMLSSTGSYKGIDFDPFPAIYKAMTKKRRGQAISPTIEVDAETANRDFNP